MPNNSSKIILITGCSSGFGLLSAARLSTQYQVIATMRDLNKKMELLSEVNRRGGKVDILQLDVTQKSSIKDAIQTIASNYGYIDVLVNNAGYGLGGFFEDLTEEEIRSQMEVNFFGVLNVTREVIPLMRQRKKGKIINMASVAGFSTSPGLGAYNASKWALEAFSESLRYELKFFGIDVLLIEPGTYQTKIFKDNARYGKNFDNKESPYFLLSRHLKEKVMDYVHTCRKDPETVAILIERLIKEKNPAFRNHPDIEARILFILRKFLPFRIYSAMIQKAILTDTKIPE